MTDWQEVAKQIVLAGSTLTAAILLSGFVWKHFLRRPLTAVWAWLKRPFDTLSFIEKELKPDHGFSTKDVLNRIERRVVVMDQRQLQTRNLDHTGRWESDAHGRFTEVNPAMARLADAMVNDFLHLGWKTLIHPSDREEVYDAMISAMDDQRDFSLQFRFVNGATVLLNGRKMIAGPDEVIGWIGDCHKL